MSCRHPRNNPKFIQTLLAESISMYCWKFTFREFVDMRVMSVNLSLHLLWFIFILKIEHHCFQNFIDFQTMATRRPILFQLLWLIHSNFLNVEVPVLQLVNKISPLHATSCQDVNCPPGTSLHMWNLNCSFCNVVDLSIWHQLPIILSVGYKLQVEEFFYCLFLSNVIQRYEVIKLFLLLSLTFWLVLKSLIMGMLTKKFTITVFLVLNKFRCWILFLQLNFEVWYSGHFLEWNLFWPQELFCYSFLPRYLLLVCLYYSGDGFLL